MTSAEREELRRRVSEARRARIQFAPNAGARNPAVRAGLTVEQMERQRANQRAWKARELAIIEALDEEWR